MDKTMAVDLGAFSKSLVAKNNDKLSEFQALKRTKNPDIPFEQKNTESNNQLKKIIAPNHLKAISDVCKKYHYTVSIRETGANSIKRIQEGAKPKPHSILEKSIKDSSVKKAYSGKDIKPIMDSVKKLNLDGFVGHWGSDGLKGVRITNPPENVLVSSGGLDHDNKEILYVPVDLNHEKGGVALEQLKASDENWQKHLFTGDYDIHESYRLDRQIMDSTPEQVNFLTRLNIGIAKEDPGREGEFHINQNQLSEVGEKSEHAMFQHGDQSTYTGAYIAQAKVAGESIAKLVEPVAQESNEPIAWCKNGDWYVTNDISQHDSLRNEFKLTKPSNWNEIEYEKTRKGEKRTTRYLGYPNSKDKSTRKSIFDSKKVDGFFAKTTNSYMENQLANSEKSLRKEQLAAKISSKKPSQRKV